MSERHEVNTRSGESGLLVVPKTKLKLTEKSFAVTGPRTWKQILGHVRAIQSHDKFKQEAREIAFK